MWVEEKREEVRREKEEGEILEERENYLLFLYLQRKPAAQIISSKSKERREKAGKAGLDIPLSSWLWRQEEHLSHNTNNVLPNKHIKHAAATL